MVAIAPTVDSAVTVPLDSELRDPDLPAHELFRFRFSRNVPAIGANNVFQIFINPIHQAVHEEVWQTRGPVNLDIADDFLVAESEDYIALHTQMNLDASDKLQDMTADAYDRLLNLVRRYDYSNLVRTWNYFPGINIGQGDSERYKLFTAGRAAAFKSHGIRKNDLPAGTAIGSDTDTPFTISAIATRQRCLMVENPRQISAYQYPRDYGPSSPSFSRAVVLRHNKNLRVLISGTASIVGHETRHKASLERQLQETLSNLDELTGAVRTQMLSGADSENKIDACIRVYLRNADHREFIQNILIAKSEQQHQIVFLRGDICRHELLLEIEAACTL